MLEEFVLIDDFSGAGQEREEPGTVASNNSSSSQERKDCPVRFQVANMAVEIREDIAVHQLMLDTKREAFMCIADVLQTSLEDGESSQLQACSSRRVNFSAGQLARRLTPTMTDFFKGHPQLI
jgi:hypothetical protein